MPSAAALWMRRLQPCLLMCCLGFCGAATLDSPFVVKPNDVEGFLAQLNRDTAALPPAEARQLTRSMLIWSLALAKHRKLDIDTIPEKDLVFMVMVKMLRYAEAQGERMTLRSFIDFTNRIEREMPDLLEEYEKVRPEMEKVFSGGTVTAPAADPTRAAPQP